jgi:hypothetical protein
MSRARDLASLLNTVATDSEIANKIDGDGSITDIVEVTQAEYDALTPDSTTLYVIVG